MKQLNISSSPELVKEKSPARQAGTNRDKLRDLLSKQSTGQKQAEGGSSRLPRKYSDNKYDNQALNAKIEEQTMKAIESLTGGIRDGPKGSSPTRPLAKRVKGPLPGQTTKPNVNTAQTSTGKKKQTNVLGLDFEIPEEL